MDWYMRRLAVGLIVAGVALTIYGPAVCCRDSRAAVKPQERSHARAKVYGPGAKWKKFPVYPP